MTDNNLQQQNNPNEPRDRHHRTFRLPPEDRQLLQDLGRIGGRQDRHQAFLDLIPIVESMTVPQKGDRTPIRLGIPTELQQAIEARAKESGQTIQDILLMAARIYQSQHSPPPPGITDEE